MICYEVGMPYMKFCPNKTRLHPEGLPPVRYDPNKMYLYANICNARGVQLSENGACPESHKANRYPLPS
jgi:hypothetical protein